jgi:hypothetical protein
VAYKGVSPAHKPTCADAEEVVARLRRAPAYSPGRREKVEGKGGTVGCGTESRTAYQRGQSQQPHKGSERGARAGQQERGGGRTLPQSPKQ